MQRRVALYSHDAQGLGHMRRNMRVAGAIATGGNYSALMISGAREANALPLPAGVDCITIPALSKSPRGLYQPRRIRLPASRLERLRSDMIRATLDSYDPHVLIVDKHPLGVNGELAAGVELVRTRGRARLILGLREVLDEPQVVMREWKRDAVEEAISQYYDAVWVYGDRRVFDPVAEYGFSPSTAAKIHYTGYLGHSVHGVGERAQPPRTRKRRTALCVLGGGEDGYALARAFARARLPDDMSALLLTGPLMPAPLVTELRRVAERREDLRVLDFHSHPEALIERSDRVVAMGGYNTVVELLSHRADALIVPRVEPRREQLIRAERLQAQGLLQLMAPAELSSDAIGDWLARPPRAHRTTQRVDLGGLDAIPRLLAQLDGPSTVDEELDRVAIPA